MVVVVEVDLVEVVLQVVVAVVVEEVVPLIADMVETER